MPSNFVTLQAFVDETLGDAPAVLTSKAIINAAGRALFNMRQWRFNRKGPVDLATVAAQAYTTLPADFGAIIALEGTPTTPIRPVDARLFSQLKTEATVWPYAGFAAFLGSEDSGSSPAPRLFLYPTPVENDADAFQLTYTAKWTELSANSDIPQIPDFVEPLFLELIQATAYAYDEDDRGGVSDRLHRIRESHLFRDAAANDSRQHGTVRSLRNGIGQFPGESRFDRSQAEWMPWR